MNLIWRCYFVWWRRDIFSILVAVLTCPSQFTPQFPIGRWVTFSIQGPKKKKKKNSLIILIPQTLRQESNITNRALHNLHNSQREKVKAISKFCSSLDRNPSNQEEIKSSSNKTHPILAILPWFLQSNMCTTNIYK